MLAEEEYKKQQEKERQERERLEKERLERERIQREIEEKNKKEINYDVEKKPQKQIGNHKKFNEYVSQRNKKEERGLDNDLEYNQGDKDLHPYFAPLARNAGGKIPTPDKSRLERAKRQGILTVTGVRLYSSLIGDDWKMREAAVKAFLEFIENPLVKVF